MKFWSAALGRAVDDGAGPHFVTIGAKQSAELVWMFLKVPETKATKNRVHVDLVADDSAVEIDRLVGLGATHVADKEEWGYTWSVLADPEGNEFCVAAAH